MSPVGAIDPASPEARWLKRATAAAVAVALSLVALKLAAWIETGSVALLSSLADSGLDALASILNLLAVRASLTPADAEHRFGHGKAEALAGLGQAAFIGGSAVFLIAESARGLIRPQPVEAEWIGIAVSLVAMAATLGLVTFQAWVLRRARSLAVDGDSLHYRSDLLLNAGVIAAIVLSSEFGMVRADPAIALAIGAGILAGAWRIGRAAYDMAMDRELPEAERQAILAIARAHPMVRDAHDLRTRMSGPRRFVQAHLALDPAMPLLTAHEVAIAVERDVLARFPDAEVLIHLDPHGADEPHPSLAYDRPGDAA